MKGNKLWTDSGSTTYQTGNAHPLRMKKMTDLPEILDEILIDTYETGMLHGEAQNNSVGVTLTQRETSILAPRSEAQSSIYEAMLEVIGPYFTQTERHWSNEDADFCGHDGTMIDNRCICEELNALKMYQRQALKKWAYGNDKEDK